MGLPTVELKTEGMLGNFRMAKFYSAIQLKSIALQKHGSNHTGPQIQDLDVVDKKAFKDDLVMTATLLHGGISYSTNVVRVAQPLGLSKPAMDLQYEFVSSLSCLFPNFRSRWILICSLKLAQRSNWKIIQKRFGIKETRFLFSYGRFRQNCQETYRS